MHAIRIDTSPISAYAAPHAATTNITTLTTVTLTAPEPILRLPPSKMLALERVSVAAPVLVSDPLPETVPLTVTALFPRSIEPPPALTVMVRLRPPEKPAALVI